MDADKSVILKIRNLKTKVLQITNHETNKKRKEKKKQNCRKRKILRLQKAIESELENSENVRESKRERVEIRGQMGLFPFSFNIELIDRKETQNWQRRRKVYEDLFPSKLTKNFFINSDL